MTDQETSPGAGSTVPALPTEFTINGRTYELVHSHSYKTGAEYIDGHMMVIRAKALKANLGKKEGCFILNHQKKIPRELRGGVDLVFPNWHHSSYSQDIVCLSWGTSCWYPSWRKVSDYWDWNARLVRRIS